MTRRSAVTGFLCALLAGCGQGSSSSSDSGSGSGSAGPTGVALQITPPAASVPEAGSIILAANLLMSDGTSQAVSVTWSVGDPFIASITSPWASSTTVTGKFEGATTITAAYFAWEVRVPITVIDAIPADPGPVYGTDENGWVYQYPPAGGGARLELYPVPGYAYGFSMDRTNSRHFLIVDEPGAGMKIVGVDLLPVSAPVDVAFLPFGDSYFGLDYDRQGRLYTKSHAGGRIYRCDPATGSLDDVGASGSYQLDVAVGPADDVYICPIMMSAGAPWISRHDLAIAPESYTSWALAPADVGGPYGSVPCGVAMNRRGEAFIGDMSTSRVYKYVDLNGDGDATDLGEETMFWSLGSVVYTSTFGITTAGGGSVLVSLISETDSETGIYWLRDMDGNGDSAGTGEAVRISPEYLQDGINGGCIAAPR